MTDRPHLQARLSERGFTQMPRIWIDDRGASVRVFESSAAEGPHVWLAITNHRLAEAFVHLSTEQAVQVAEQLQYLVDNHYQGDAGMERGRP